MRRTGFGTLLAAGALAATLGTAVPTDAQAAPAMVASASTIGGSTGIDHVQFYGRGYYGGYRGGYGFGAGPFVAGALLGGALAGGYGGYGYPVAYGYGYPVYYGRPYGYYGRPFYGPRYGYYGRPFYGPRYGYRRGFYGRGYRHAGFRY